LYKIIIIYIYTGLWLGTFFIFHNIHGIILPIDFHILYFKMIKTTNQNMYVSLRLAMDINEWQDVQEENSGIF